MPQEEQVDGVQAIFLAKTLESSLEKYAKFFIQEEDDLEETFKSPSISPNIASPPDPFNEKLLTEDIREEWSNGIIDFSEAFWIDSPSITIPCSIKGIAVEAQLIPNIEGNIMPWHLAHTLLGSVSLKPSGKLFESCPFGHILECRGIASAVPITIDKIEVNLDFHIFDILDFDLLIGYPLENFYHSPLGSLHEKLGEKTSASPCLENPTA